MKGQIFTIWSLLDPLYFRCTRLTYLANRDNIFRIRLTRYKGKKRILNDGTTIDKDDLLVKIHLHNVKLLAELKDVKSEIKKAMITYQKVKTSLPGITQYITNHQEGEKIKGIVGITLLTKGTQHLGFNSFPIKNPFYKLFKYLSFVPIAILFGTNPFARKQDVPSYLLMSKETLQKMYH
ncbi:YkoP family protein [Aquibacillus sediminis]|uniref:YkoP family protein n=1 Tax=Aquibacillus sediminis TaxID=2574734 RepID=UPI0011098D24|nr:hypothetical protein [Aquibacillus sediminis]